MGPAVRPTPRPLGLCYEGAKTMNKLTEKAVPAKPTPSGRTPATPPLPPERSVRVLLTHVEGCPGTMLVRIAQDGKATEYWVAPLPSDFGMAYRLTKNGEGIAPVSVYDVLLEVEGDSCTCPGHTYSGYCRHV